MSKREWSDIFRNWGHAQADFGINLERTFDFTEVQPDKVPRFLADNGVDWWATHLMDQKLADMKADSKYVVRGDTPKGVLRTVELLEENGGDWERQSAVYLMAALWQKQASLPDNWRGETCSMLNDLYLIIRRHFPNLGGWHHSVRHTLPLSLTAPYHGGNFGFGTKRRELMHLFVFEAAAIKGTWTLVKLRDGGNDWGERF